jgi:hypothetical protein
MGVWWSRVLNGIIIKEIDINGLSSAERKLHNILWPLSVLIFIISFLKVIFTDVDK